MSMHKAPEKGKAADLFNAYQGLPGDEQRAFVALLGRAARGACRCPAREETEQCVRDEEHMGGHVSESGREWLVALRCRIGATGHAALCERIEGHEGACVSHAVPTPSPALAPPPRSLLPRGVCPCGATRKEHEKNGLGRCPRTGCAKYGARVQP